MIKKVAHLADIHIEREVERHEEYKLVFDRLTKKLEKAKPDRIVIVGDLFHNKLNIRGEQFVLASNFLKSLSNIAKVIITRGNHDIDRNALGRKDSIASLVEIMENDNVDYYNQTGFYPDENVVWAVWNHGDVITPYDLENEYLSNKDGFIIDLFHNPVRGSSTDTGKVFNEERYISIDSFKGSLSFFGDIHKYQTFDNGKRAYSGSLLQRDFSETIDGHGFLLWDIRKKQHKFIEIDNDYSFNEIIIEEINDLDDYKYKNFKKYPRIKPTWIGTSSELKDYHKHKLIYEKIKKRVTPYELYKINKIIRDEENDFIESANDLSVLKQEGEINTDILKNFLHNKGYKDNVIEHVRSIDSKISEQLFAENKNNDKKNIKLLSMKMHNFMGYGDNISIPWDDLQGIIAISAPNRVGKSTIINGILFNLYGKSMQTAKDKRRVFNNKRPDVKNVSVYCEYSVNNEIIGVERSVNRKFKKSGELDYSPVKVEIYKTDKNDQRKLVIDNSFKDSIESIWGEYDDFIRNNIITGDIINGYLSVTPSVFKDALIKDLGLDVYESKLEAFKKYKKEYYQSNGYLSLDINEKNDKIKSLKEENSELNEKKHEKNNELEKLDERIKKGENYINELYKKMLPVDEEHINIDIESLRNDIKKHTQLVEEGKKLYKTNYVETLKKELSKKENDQLKLMEQANKCNQDIDTFFSEIEKNREKYNHYVNEYNSKLNFYNEKISNFENEKNRIKEEGVSLKDKIKHKQELIEENNKHDKNIRYSIDQLSQNGICESCGMKILELSEEEIDSKKNKLNNDIELIQEKIKKLNDEIKNIEKNVVKKRNDFLTIDKNIIEETTKKEEELHHYQSEIEKIETNISDLKQQKKLVEQKKNSINFDYIATCINDLRIKIENCYKWEDIYLKLKSMEIKEAEYDKSIKNKENNDKIEVDISNAQKKLNNLIDEKETIKDYIQNNIVYQQK